MDPTQKNIIEDNEIRYIFDEESGEFYFSIVDVIEVLGVSKDSRNYWKVLKNRLNKRDNGLITECNQHKMQSSDGKYYLTDAGKIGTILAIVQLISPTKVRMFEEFFNQVERKNSKKEINYFSKDEYPEETPMGDFDGEIKLDIYQRDNCLFIVMMMAGVEKEDIVISLDCKKINFRFNRPEKSHVNEKNFLAKELAWGKFGRTLELPYEVDIDRVETNFTYGLLSVKLFILDKTRTKIVKIK